MGDRQAPRPVPKGPKPPPPPMPPPGDFKVLLKDIRMDPQPIVVGDDHESLRLRLNDLEDLVYFLLTNKRAESGVRAELFLPQSSKRVFDNMVDTMVKRSEEE